MPINYKDYPSNWKEISRSIINRAKDRCELCGAPNYVRVVRPDGLPQRWQLKQGGDHNRGKWVKIILTVHHIDSDKKNNHSLNLLCLCARCHLRLDAYRHLKNRRNKNKNGDYLWKGSYECHLETGEVFK